jgi:ferredoxin
MILCFSGTGNSRHAAHVLADLLGDSLTDMNGLIKDRSAPDLPSEMPYVVVAPVYAWRMPRAVSDFLEKAQLTRGQKVYFVLTCGSEMNGADRYALALAKKKQLVPMGTAEVLMPENYIALFSVPEPEAARKIILRADGEVRAIGTRILRGERLPEAKKTLLKMITSGPVNAMFYKFYVSAGKFRATKKCVGCGWCVRACPLNNIALRDKRPVWGGNCTHCMACIGGCPEKAIEYGNHTVGKRRYYLK